MEKINILIIVSAFVLLLILWITVAARHFKYLKSEIKEQWQLLDESLRKRQDLIPNLIETMRMYFKDKEELVEKLVKDRQNAVKDYCPCAKKIEYEHELSAGINTVIEMAEKDRDFGKDTNFLELKTEIEDLEDNVEMKTKKYNQMVRYFNSHRNKLLLHPVAAVFGFGMMNIFEVEK